MKIKNIIYLTLSLAFILGMTSCKDYLDINVDPDNPITTNTSVDVRLPWIQNYYAYAWGTAGMRGNTVIGLLTQTDTSTSNGYLAAWNPQQATCTTAYQNWYIGAGVNIPPMLKLAEENGEYHYMGAGYCIYAMGFMMMLDLHGELPMEESFTLKTDPVYDDGKKIYNQCMEALDKAIQYFNMDQPVGAVSLRDGDLWNGGDVSKWLKLCYGLKARYMLKLSKKADLYKPDEILKALENAPQANADNTFMKHYNVDGDEVNFTVSDPYQTSALWNTVAYGTTQRTTRYYVNLFKHQMSDGTEIIDPRMTKFIPAMMSNVQLNESGNITSYEWRRDIGVDMMNSTKRRDGGPYQTIFATVDKNDNPYVDITYEISDAAERQQFYDDARQIHYTTIDGEKVTVRYQQGSAYCNTTNHKLAGDTVYVNLRTNSLSTNGRGNNDFFYYPSTDYPFVAGTGNFYARPNSDTDLLTYHEMCFIKAEVLYNTDRAASYNAYIEGVKAHFERMQTKLNEWKSAGTENPDELPMDEGEIQAFLNSPAIAQSAAELTLSEIMLQKLIAMGFDLENWNDIRRLNYRSDIYTDYKRPEEFSGGASKIIGSDPSDITYWFRRWSQSTHESNYNNRQLMASNKLAMTDPIWSCPVWWDCATDDEYYSYIK